MKLYHKLFNCTSLTPKTYYFGMVSNGKKKKRKPYKTKNITHSIAKGYIEDFTQIRTQQNLEGNYEKKSTNQQQKKSIRKKKKVNHSNYKRRETDCPLSYSSLLFEAKEI